MNEATRYVVKYRRRGENVDRTFGNPPWFDEFATRDAAIVDRNWLFSHSRDVVACWIEDGDGKTTGAVLVRDDEED